MNKEGFFGGVIPLLGKRDLCRIFGKERPTDQLPMRYTSSIKVEKPIHSVQSSRKETQWPISYRMQVETALSFARKLYRSEMGKSGKDTMYWDSFFRDLKDTLLHLNLPLTIATLPNSQKRDGNSIAEFIRRRVESRLHALNVMVVGDVLYDNNAPNIDLRTKETGIPYPTVTDKDDDSEMPPGLPMPSNGTLFGDED